MIYTVLLTYHLACIVVEYMKPYIIHVWLGNENMGYTVLIAPFIKYLLYPLLLLFDSKVIPYMVSIVYIPYGILKHKHYQYNYTWNV